MATWTDDLRTLDQFPESAYQAIDLNRLMVFVVARLGALHLPVTFEALVVAAYRLFPGKFSLEAFHEYPDAARVNRALMQLRPKYRNWATGDVQRGFVLTEGGKRTLAEVTQALSSDAPPSATSKKPLPRASKARTKNLASDLLEVEQSALFRSFAKGDGISPDRADDVFALLGAYAYAPKRALRERYDSLLAASEHAAHQQTREFLIELRRRYRLLFQD